MTKKILLNILVVISAVSFFPLAAGFEAHVVNVTAKIERRPCQDFDIRSQGFWKTHPEHWILPQTLGDMVIDTEAEAAAIFDTKGNDMADKLRIQLLALKFNIAVFAVGDALVPGESVTINELVAEADALLIEDPPATKDELEEMKDRLESANVAGKVSTCPDGVDHEADNEEGDDEINTSTPTQQSEQTEASTTPATATSTPIEEEETATTTEASSSEATTTLEQTEESAVLEVSTPEPE